MTRTLDMYAQLMTWMCRLSLALNKWIGFTIHIWYTPLVEVNQAIRSLVVIDNIQDSLSTNFLNCSDQTRTGRVLSTCYGRRQYVTLKWLFSSDFLIQQIYYDSPFFWWIPEQRGAVDHKKEPRYGGVDLLIQQLYSYM